MGEDGTSTSLRCATLCKCHWPLQLTRSRLPILTDISFVNLTLDRRHGLVVHARATAPPGRPRATTVKSRVDYWQQSKRMPQGGLVALVTRYKHGDAQLAIGILTMSEQVH